MRKSIGIHAVIFDRMIFSKTEDILNFAAANQFSTDKMIEGDDLVELIQRDKSDFKLNAFGDKQDFRVVMMKEGVALLIGELEEGVTKREGYAIKPHETTHKTFSFNKVDEAKRIVTGPVLVPGVVDLQGDFEFPEDIEEAAYKFMEDARNIGEMHTKFGGIGIPVESWVLREDIFVDKGSEFKIYPKGTWLLSVRVQDDKVWEKVRNGDLTGFSIGFRGTREGA